jgi:hypothetical protein
MTGVRFARRRPVPMTASERRVAPSLTRATVQLGTERVREAGQTPHLGPNRVRKGRRPSADLLKAD